MSRRDRGAVRPRTVAQRLERAPAGTGGTDLAVAALSVVFIALPLIFYLHQHVEMLRVGYEIDALKQTRTELLEQRRTLSVERARLGRLSIVEERAREAGLVAPEPERVFVVAARD